MLTSPQQIRSLVLHEDAVATADGELARPASPGGGGYAWARLQIEGINGDTVDFEGSLDGVTYYAVEFTSQGDSTIVADSATADGMWHANVAGLNYLRARLTRVNGTVTVLCTLY